jgi:hypothetical protein
MIILDFETLLLSSQKLMMIILKKKNLSIILLAKNTYMVVNEEGLYNQELFNRYVY